MKKIIFLILMPLYCSNAVSQIGNISLPEMQILYRGYDNKIIPNIPCGQQLELFVEGATFQKASWSDDQGQNQVGYTLRVNGSTRNVVVKVNGLDEKGNVLSSSSQIFIVKPFPAAHIQNDRISKTSGMRAIVGLGPDCPFTGISFEVIGGSITFGNQELTFIGSIIPSSLLEGTKPGQKVALTVSYNSNSENIDIGQRVCHSILEVVP